MLISIISGTYNRLPLLQAMVASVRADIPVGMAYEFILCDGGSTDGTIEWCQEQSDITLIQHGELRGAIDAFTDAGRQASGKYTLILNDDVEVMPGSIVPALVYLEEHEQCGGVAFADNRKSPYNPNGEFRTMKHPVQRDGHEDYNVYIQCGLIRTWLGQRVNWWRGFDERFTARTYGGDNLMTSNILALGYGIEPLTSCKVIDHVHDDELRARNNAVDETGQSADTGAGNYYTAYPKGPIIPPAPTVEQQDKRQLRVLYLPIYEPGHPLQKQQKRGLRDALARRYIVYELDYLSIDPRRLPDVILGLLDSFQPDLMLSQIHGYTRMTADLLARIRSVSPRLVIVNWNGDYWPDGLTSPPMLDVLRYVDLQLTVNHSVIETYEQRGIRAGYWQIGYEDPAEPLPDMPAHDVVFLGSNYSDLRGWLYKAVEDAMPEGSTFAFYGANWAQSAGDTLYDFARSAALYRNARLSLGDNQFPNAHGFVSNRLFQALAAGGALLLHQHVNGLEELTGITAGQHYIEWRNFDDLIAAIRYWLDPAHESQRRAMARAGCEFVRQRHSFEARVRELFEEHLPRARRQPHAAIALRFLGAIEEGGVNGPITGKHYHFTKNRPLYIDPLDEPLTTTGLWERIS